MIEPERRALVAIALADCLVQSTSRNGAALIARSFQKLKGLRWRIRVTYSIFPKRLRSLLSSHSVIRTHVPQLSRARARIDDSWSSCAPAADPRGTDPSYEGVAISILVGPDGTLKESKVTGSSGSAYLDQAIRAALSGCKFTPRTIDGEPVPEATWTGIWMGSRARWMFPKPPG